MRVADGDGGSGGGAHHERRGDLGEAMLDTALPVDGPPRSVATV
jgi:hypothetical protein